MEKLNSLIFKDWTLKTLKLLNLIRLLPPQSKGLRKHGRNTDIKAAKKIDCSEKCELIIISEKRSIAFTCY
jgi:hypothetical protein